MVKNNQQTFKQLYQEQYECYPALTQDEVVALYATEGINAETDEEITKKLQKYLDLKKQELKNLKYDTSLNSYIRSVFGLPVDDELTELEDYISALEEHTKAIQQVHQATPENSEEFHVSLETIEALYYDLRPNSFDEYDAAIEDGICQLIKGNTSIEDGIENLIYQIADKKTQVEEMKKRNNLNKDAKAKTFAPELFAFSISCSLGTPPAKMIIGIFIFITISK